MQDHILKEVEQLFMKYGTKSITMDDIARHLGVSKKTIYAHFKDKDDLISKLFNAKMIEDVCEMEKASENAANAIDEVFSFMDSIKVLLSEFNPILFYDLKKYHQPVYKLFIEFQDVHIYQNVKKNLERGIAEKLYRKDIDTEILANMRRHQIFWTLESDLLHAGKYTLTHLMQETTEHFLYGVATLEGLKIINNHKQTSEKVN